MQLPKVIENPTSDWEKLQETFRNTDPVGKFETDILVQLTIAMIEKDISQRELARRCELSQSTVARIFGSQASMNMTTFLKFCLALDLTIEFNQKTS